MKMRRMIGDYEPGEKGESFEEISARIDRNRQRMTKYKDVKNSSSGVNPLIKLMGLEIDLSTKKKSR